MTAPWTRNHTRHPRPLALISAAEACRCAAAGTLLLGERIAFRWEPDGTARVWRHGALEVRLPAI